MESIQTNQKGLSEWVLIKYMATLLLLPPSPISNNHFVVMSCLSFIQFGIIFHVKPELTKKKVCECLYSKAFDSTGKWERILIQINSNVTLLAVIKLAIRHLAVG